MERPSEEKLLRIAVFLIALFVAVAGDPVLHSVAVLFGDVMFLEEIAVVVIEPNFLGHDSFFLLVFH